MIRIRIRIIYLINDAYLKHDAKCVIQFISISFRITITIVIVIVIVMVTGIIYMSMMFTCKLCKMCYSVYLYSVLIMINHDHDHDRDQDHDHDHDLYYVNDKKSI